MKAWKWVILSALALVSCIKEEMQEPEPSLDIEGLPITIRFSVQGPPVDKPTKAVGDGLDSDLTGGLETLHLAVFGGSGYLKDYKEARLIGDPTMVEFPVEKKVQKKDGDNHPLYYEVTTDPGTGEETVTDIETTEYTGHPVYIVQTITRTVPTYNYEVTLPMSTSNRTIHFLGNGPSTLPFGWDSDVIPVQLSQLRKYTEAGAEEEKSLKAKAYWQMKTFQGGITAKKEGGYYVSAPDDNGHKYRYGVSKEEDEQFYAHGGFQVEDAVNDQFKNIPLIRNWAKIVLYSLPKEQSHFEAISMAVINVPSRGSIAPYSTATGGFVNHYETKGFDELRAMNYPASLPSGTLFDTSIPEASEFVPKQPGDPGYEDQFIDGGRVALASSLEDLYSQSDNESAVYLYERPAPSESIPPSYVIIYGKYYEHPESPDDHGEPCYYKVDLMETIADENGDLESRYYPIYRNFKYQIWVSRILSKGHATPQAAAASAGSADVSADVTTGHLSDISDGIGRLHLNWMAKTYTAADEEEETTLHVYFSNQTGAAITETDQTKNQFLKAELLPPTDKKKLPNGDYDDVIEALELKALPVTTQESEGWLQVYFKVKRYEGRTARSQTIRITGVQQATANSPASRIYRDVVISVLPKQPLKVTCEQERIFPRKGEEETISFSIPDGLLKSMFPLTFTIEADRMTLSPDLAYPEENMSVVYGESTSLHPDYAGKPAFQYLRTISWDDYRDSEKFPLTMGADERMWRTVTCHFKTNCDNNHAKVWVTNPFFIHEDIKGSSWDEFYNFNYKEFHELKYPDPVPCLPDQPVRFVFSVDAKGKDAQQHDIYPEITMTLRGLAITEEIANLNFIDTGVYSFTPTNGTNEFSFRTLNNMGDICVTLEAEDYYTASLEPYHFNKGMPKYSYGLLEGFKNGSNWSNVAYGRVESGLKYSNASDDRAVIFAYFTDPADPHATTIRLTDAEGNYIGGNSEQHGRSSGLYAVSPGSYQSGWTPTGPTGTNGMPNYHEVVLKTATKGSPSYDPIVFRLEADGYVTQEFRYERLRKPRLHSLEVKNSDMKTWFQEDGSAWVIYPPSIKDESYFKLKIEKLDAGAPDPVLDNSGNLCLGGTPGSTVATDARYRLTFMAGDPGMLGLPFSGSAQYKAQRFYYCKFTFVSSNRPAEATPDSDAGTYFRYPGSSTDFQWIAFNNVNEYPGDRTSGDWSPLVNQKSITFTVGSNPIQLSGFMYKALSEVQ